MYRAGFITLLISVCAVPVAAQDVVVDAFGVLPADAVSVERQAWAGLQGGAGTRVTPPEDPDTLLLFVGPKTMVAGYDDGHAVTLVLDQWGNLAGAGETVVFTLGDQARRGTVRDGIGDVVFVPTPVSGTFAAGAELGGRQSTRVLFRVTADLASVSPSLNDAEVATEERARIETGPLIDRFGNVVEDGTALQGVFEHVDGSFTVTSGLALDGAAQFSTLARGFASDARTQAFLAGNASQKARLTLNPATPLGETQVALWALPHLDAVAIRLGPVLTSRGYLLTDGAPVHLTITGQTRAAAEAGGWLRDGYFEANVALDPADGPFDLTIVTPLGGEARSVALSDAPETLIGTE